MPSQFEWDEEKDRANRAKHSIDFEEAKVIFDGPVLTAADECLLEKSLEQALWSRSDTEGLIHLRWPGAHSRR